MRRRCTATGRSGSLPSRGAWIEIFLIYHSARETGLSLPSRGAWIEIDLRRKLSSGCKVAPLAGSVDRNESLCGRHGRWEVAPLAGSVDRNDRGAFFLKAVWVAPLAGSVDRNNDYDGFVAKFKPVAPLAGSVDRNRGEALDRQFSQVAPLAGSVDRNNWLNIGKQLVTGRSPRGERG